MQLRRSDDSPEDTFFQTRGLDTLGMLRAVLNQVDYGLVVVDVGTRQLLFSNAPARLALEQTSNRTPELYTKDGRLCVRQLGHAQRLSLALARTKTHLRSLITLNDGDYELSIAVMPLSASPFPGARSGDAAKEPVPSYALLLFAKPQLCDSTSVTLFASERGLTRAEAQVLAQICKGLRPTEIAVQHGVQVCTVRSQLRSIRQKTASDSIRDLVEKVSVLPPLALQVSKTLTGFDPRHLAFS